MIPCCWLDALLWASHVSVSEPSRLGVVRETRSPLPVLGPSCGRVVSVSEQLRRWAGSSPTGTLFPGPSATKGSLWPELDGPAFWPPPPTPSPPLPPPPRPTLLLPRPAPQFSGAARRPQAPSPPDLQSSRGLGAVRCTHSPDGDAAGLAPGARLAASSSEPQPQAVLGDGFSPPLTPAGSPCRPSV